MPVSKMQRYAAGFTLIEVLVAMVVTAVGLFGLAKLQAMSVANTQVSRVRSLVALQLESLAASMHGNSGFWGSAGTAPPTFSMSGATVTDTTGVLGAVTPDCSSATCSPAQLAAYDVQAWAASMAAHFPTYAAVVNCNSGPNVPATCNMTVTWQESYKASSQNTVVAGGQTATQSLTLYVQP